MRLSLYSSSTLLNFSSFCSFNFTMFLARFSFTVNSTCYLHDAQFECYALLKNEFTEYIEPNFRQFLPFCFYISTFIFGIGYKEKAHISLFTMNLLINC